MSNKSLSAIFIAIFMMVWLLSGEIASTTLTAAPDTATAEDKMPTATVRGFQSVSESRRIELDVRGTTGPNRVVDVRAEIAGKIESLPAIKGSHVKKGQLLCKIAVDTRQLELDEASARLKAAQLEHDGIVDLGKSGLQSNINIAQAGANLETSRANVKRATLALQKTRVVAPFAGIVETQPVEVGDFLSPGSTCVTLMELDPLLVTGHVAEKSIASVSLGDEVPVALITGETMTGRVSFIAQSPDRSTRTFPIEVTVDNPDVSIRAGLSSTMRIPLAQKEAHLVSPGYFVLDDAGSIGVKIVDGRNRVQFMEVTIIAETAAGVWVSGLPAEANIITVGQEDVLTGQEVVLDLSPLTAVVSN